MINFIENLFNAINIFDVITFIIIIFFTIQCFIKGFSLSLISFMKWVLSTVITIILVPKLRPIVSDYIESEFINNFGLGITIFVFTLFITILLGKSLGKAVTWTGLGSIDKSFGDLDLSKVSVDFNNDQASSGPKRHGSFDKTLINFYYSQWINENLNFKTSGLAQFSNKNLDSSEQLSLGGITGVRAYPSGEASGDQGYKLTAELQTNLSEFLNNDVSATLFYDYGRIQQYKDPSNITLTTPNKYSLSGWGVAFDFNPNQDFSLSLVFSKTLGSNNGKSNAGMNSDGRDDDSRAWLLLSYKF